jgi:hypothetical protein
MSDASARREQFAIVAKRCPLCGIEESHEIPMDGFMRWKAGGLIQRALPDSAWVDECIREFLITGMCKDCRDETDEITARAEDDDGDYRDMED